MGSRGVFGLLAATSGEADGTVRSEDRGGGTGAPDDLLPPRRERRAAAAAADERSRRGSTSIL